MAMAVRKKRSMNKNNYPCRWRFVGTTTTMIVALLLLLSSDGRSGVRALEASNKKIIYHPFVEQQHGANAKLHVDDNFDIDRSSNNNEPTPDETIATSTTTNTNTRRRQQEQQQETTTSSSSSSSTTPNKRKVYPEYCSKPQEEMLATRSIPTLSSKWIQSYPNLQILQVHVIIRHGARTPDSVHTCWDGYNEVWDCNLTTAMRPYSTHNDKEIKTPNSKFLFQKVYDALHPPLANALNGTCQIGQLLSWGYDQEYLNGKFLCRAYVHDDDANANDEITINSSSSSNSNNMSYVTPKPMKLFDNAIFNANHVRIRGDDMERILVSGQTLVEALFDTDNQTKEEVVVPFHTADREYDTIQTNRRICQRLDQLNDVAVSSPEYTFDNENSQEAKQLSAILKSTGSNWDDILDCLMTQICNDRTVHPTYNDFVPSNRHVGDTEDSNSSSYSSRSNSVFNRIVQFRTWQKIFHYRYNDAAYSKLAMGPLWADIVWGLNVTRDDSVQGVKDMDNRNMSRLFLFSGHDATVMPFLATLGDGVWDGKWTPYASMVVIESYAVGKKDRTFPSGKAFRIIYNGNVLTNKICRSELCDLDVLLNMVRPFATYDRQCDRMDIKLGDDSTTNNVSPKDHPVHLTTMLWIGIVAFCSVMSSVLTFVVVTWTEIGRTLMNSKLGYGRLSGGRSDLEDSPANYGALELHPES